MDITFPPSQRSTSAHAILRSLADSASMLIWMVDANNVCTYLNQGTAPIIVNFGELDIAAWMEFIHSDDLARVAPLFKSAQDARREYKIEYRIVKTDGSIRWVTGSGAPRFTADGEFIGYVGAVLDISDQRAVLENLAKSEAGYRLLTESSSDVITHHGPDGRLIYVSPSIKNVLGYEPAEVLGTNIYNSVRPDNAEVIRAEVARQVNDGADSRTIEFSKRHKNGHRVWMATRAQVVLDPLTREKIGTVSVSRDVTAERQAKEDLRKREERFRSLTQLSTDWYWETDAQDRFTFISKGMETLWHISTQKLLGKSTFDLVDDAAQPGLLAYSEKIAAREPFKDIRYAVAGVSGERRSHISLSGEPVFEQGDFVGYRGITRDVTGETLVSRRLAELAEENKALIENSLDIMALLDKDGRFLRINGALKDILGYETEEFIGRQYVEFLSPDDRDMTAAVDAGLRTGLNTVQDFETRWIRKDGVIVHLSLGVRWSDDQQLMYATARDVTERHYIRTELQKSKNKLSSILESIGDAFFALDRNWRTTYVNSRTARFIGRTNENLIGRILWEAVPEILDSPVLPYYQRAMETGENIFFEEYYAPSKAWVEVRVYPHEDGLSVFFHDITERRAAESTLRNSERRLRDVIEMTPAGYMLTDASGLLTGINPALSDMCGYTEPELLGRHIGSLLPICPCDGALAIPHGLTIVQGKEGALKHKDGHLVYVLVNANIERDNQGNALSLTAFLTDITERKQTESRLVRLATHDTLTGLPNRTQLNHRLGQILAATHAPDSVAVMFIDLDRFKEVNDSMGHEPGDVLLCAVADRLSEIMRPTDIIARQGGDEFIAVASCSNGEKSAQKIATKLLASLKTPFDIKGQEVHVSASIGISMFPKDAGSQEVLLQHADTAMYRAKAAGRNAYCFFQAEMNVEAKLRMTLEQALHRALERQEFELHYQPRVDLTSLQVIGMEALIRWNHPELGCLSPAQFIPIAEERGLIKAIGRWVLEKACMDTRHLIDDYGHDLRVSVNLSARQLQCADLMEQVLGALKKAELPANLLELELTESAIIEDMEVSTRMLKDLKKLGILLSVDDFGTGYSALAYLQRFPLDILKLDRSFINEQIDGKQNAKFIRAFIDLAHTLNLSVVAEGVETGEILKFLRTAACDEGQGYYFSKPLPLDEFRGFLC